jgi:hypothetical protein
MEALGELIRAPDGQLWHIAHMPLHWGANSCVSTPKADTADPIHDRLNASIGERLLAGRETRFRGLPDPDGQEGRAILYGIVWPKPIIAMAFCGRDVESYDEAGERAVAQSNSLATLHGNFSRSWLGRLDAYHCNFGPGAEFFHVCFAKEADFTAAVFNGRADFNDAWFSEGAKFNYATFSSQTRFDGVQFMDRAEFHSTRFLGLAEFPGVTFYEGVTFETTEFLGNAHFHRANFLNGASGDCSTEVGANYEGTIFSKRAFFPESSFSAIVNFKGATFGDEVSFDDGHFSKKVSFELAEFARAVSFERSIYTEDVSFLDAKFDGNTHFGEAKFARGADFRLACFSDGAFFSQAKFGGRLTFATARFVRNAIFSKVEIPADEFDWRWAFTDALFEFTLDLRGVDLRSVSAFAGATLNRGVLLDRMGERQESELHAHALQLAVGADDRENALYALEGGASKLKLAMERESDKLREQRFYRLELRARRRQLGTPLAEKIFSALYAAASNYGASIGRPVILIFGMVVALAVSFYALDAALHPNEVARDPIAAASQALDFSWSNVFKPFIPLPTQGDLDIQNPLAFRLLHGGLATNYVIGFIVRVVATLQAIIALVLVFLLALAVRRRFQIS